MRAQRIALAAAQRLRAEYLIAVHEGVLLPLDLIEAAATQGHQALRSVQLKEVFLSPPEPSLPWRIVRTRLLAALALAPSTPDAKLTVGWVLDPRAGGRRWFALRDAMRDRAEVPWERLLWL